LYGNVTFRTFFIPPKHTALYIVALSEWKLLYGINKIGVNGCEKILCG